jgi:hypothetical protein
MHFLFMRMFIPVIAIDVFSSQDMLIKCLYLIRYFS